MSENKPAENILQAYHTLGLRPGQDAAQVKHAYHTLARALHPDRNPDAQVLMARINQAYATLNAYFKTLPSNKSAHGWLQPLNRLAKNISTQVSSWMDAAPRHDLPKNETIQLPDALPEDSSGWVLLGITQDGRKLVYIVEISGNPKALALPLRRRRPCNICQGVGKIWQQGQSTACGNCGGRGYITKPASINVILPEKWHNGQRLSVESYDISVPLEVELHRPAGQGSNFETKV